MKRDFKKKGLLLYLSFMLLALPLLLLAPVQADACTWVNGYTRKDGTHVSGYWRGCGSSSGGSSSSTSSSSSTTSTTTQGQYYGVSSIVNLYHGTNFAGTADTSKLVYVKGYYRQDGTYVRPHYRTHANSYLLDNFTAQGLSTLLPREKYPAYQYEREFKPIEKYLMYNTDDKQLTKAQLKTLKNYAELLYKYDSKPELKESVTETAFRFYMDIYNDETKAAHMVQFDLNANQTLEEYLMDVVLANQSQTYGSYIHEMELIIPIYAYYLKEAQLDPAKKEAAQAVGSKFYGLLNNGDTSSNNQVEMDLLQRFERTDENALTSHAPFELGYDGYNVINNYIGSIGKLYGFSVGKYDLDIVAYDVTLELLNKSYNSLYEVDSAYREGIAYYTSKGLTSSQAETQTKRDILTFYKYLER